MKQKRKLMFLTAMLLFLTTLFAGCVLIPDEYTKGVRLDSSYPKDDLPIMKDAVIFFCDADDETVSVKYGVEDDLDDVADFYKDHFDDNDIVLDDESDKSSRYTAEGSYKDFVFELRAGSPSGQYEEKLFETVVKIDIEFIEGTVPTPGIAETEEPASLEQDILGFWRQESFEDGTGVYDTYDYGQAYEFLADGTLNVYINYVYAASGGWAYIDESTILLTTVDLSQENVSVAQERRDGIDYLIWTDSTGTLTFFRDSAEGFSMTGGDDNNGDDNANTQQLEAALIGPTWYYYHYADSMANLEKTVSGYEIYYNDGTFDYSFDDAVHKGTWYIQDGRLYCTYEDGSSSNWYIEFIVQRGINLLLYYDDSAPGSYWLYADISRDTIPGNVDNSVVFLTDQEMTYAIMGFSCNYIPYYHPDGTIEEYEDSAVFHEDGSYEENVNGYYDSGTWQFYDGYLELRYTDGTYLKYPAFVEYNKDVGSYFMYLYDLEEGHEGGYWVFTDYEP